MKTSEIRELSTADLIDRIDAERTMLIRMRMNHAITPLDNPQKLKQAKLTIARLNTELRSRELKQKSK
ncbi:MAG TPA: 50S ribosomal protein L29 [Bacteroidales bacterium]|jgi:large subunit ribosomal protein L29|nr:50S ribosomal protein L29 [Bacteroidales bacterium]HQB36336.1 50S ribosomal protein L29 [Bacteroidales bacterium]